MAYAFPTNGDFDSWVSSSKPRTVKQYVDWITDFANYCRHEGLNIYDGQSVKSFLVFRHETPKVAKRSNRRQKVVIGEDIKQKTGELYSILSAIKHYFSMFNLRNATESHPTIINMLVIWSKDDVAVLKSPIFEGDEIEMFCAYADNSSWNIVCKVVVLIYIACAGRIGELNNILWEDIRQVQHESQQCWMFKYMKEKQTGTPEEVESMLGDEISNLAFNLYTDYFKPEERNGRLFRYLRWDSVSNILRATEKVIGKNKIAEVPRTVAWWNDLPKADLYTVHSFRRTAASKMAENGATILEIMLAGGWKSDKVARTYVEKSMRTKKRISNLLNLFAWQRSQSRIFISDKWKFNV
eukprot:gene35919-46631_t